MKQEPTKTLVFCFFASVPGLCYTGTRINYRYLPVITFSVLISYFSSLFSVLDSHHKRYVASRGENVIGVVLAKAGDTFRVDIGTREDVKNILLLPNMPM